MGSTLNHYPSTHFVVDRDGDAHVNGAAVYNDNSVDVSPMFDAIGITGSTTVAADILAIPVTHAVVVKTTGADGEALTLADGTPGQLLTITLGTDGGGDGTLTPTTKTGYATIVFADAGDTATLKFVDSTVGWVIVGLAGVSAPPAITI